MTESSRLQAQFIRFCNWYTSLPWIMSLLLLICSAISLALIIDTFVVQFTSRFFNDLSWRLELNTLLTSLLVSIPLVSFVTLLIKFLHKLRMDLTRLNLELEKANNVKTVFLSNMSHELRTPLNAILGFAQYLEIPGDVPLDKDQQESVNHILISGNHLLNLINDILDVAKIEAGKLKLSNDQFSSQEILDESLVMLNEFAISHNVTIEHRRIDNIPINADHVRTKQILVNVINNSIKYNKPDGKVFVSCYPYNQFVRFEIEDTGIGISETKKLELYQAFNRLGADKLQIEGNGIGLSLTKNLTEAMGGKIYCKSKINEGTTFYIDLPLAQNFNLSNKLNKSFELQSISDLSAEIIYIENEQSNQELIEIYFKKFQNISLFTVNTLQRAIEICEEIVPDLIITDMNLPDAQGNQIMETLHQNAITKNIPVIILTADILKSNLAQQAFPELFIQHKPVQLDELINSIAQVIHHKKK